VWSTRKTSDSFPSCSSEAPLPPSLAGLDGEYLPAVEDLVCELAVQPLVQRRRDADRGQQVRVHPREVLVAPGCVRRLQRRPATWRLPPASGSDGGVEGSKIQRRLTGPRSAAPRSIGGKPVQRPAASSSPSPSPPRSRRRRPRPACPRSGCGLRRRRGFADSREPRGRKTGSLIFGGK